MVKNDWLSPLLSTLKDLLRWLRIRKVPNVIIGGVAASILGRPRTTRDVDAVIWLDEPQWKDFIESGKHFGFQPRLSDCLAFAHKSRVLLLRHSPTGIDVDLSLGALPFEREMIEQAHEIKIKRISIPLPRPEDLIVMKAIAHRGRDLADIEALLDVHRKLDVNRILTLVKDFTEVLEIPEVYEDIKRLLGKKNSM